MRTLPVMGARTGRPKPMNSCGGSGRRNEAAVYRELRPCSSTGTRSIEWEVAARSVPWLGTRSAGLFRTSSRPVSGEDRCTGAPFEKPLPDMASPSARGMEVGRPQGARDRAGDHLQLLHLLVEVGGDVLQRPEAQARGGAPDDPPRRIGGSHPVEAVAVQLGQRVERVIDLEQAM